MSSACVKATDKTTLISSLHHYCWYRRRHYHDFAALLFVFKSGRGSAQGWFQGELEVTGGAYTDNCHSFCLHECTALILQDGTPTSGVFSPLNLNECAVSYSAGKMFAYCNIYT